MQPDHLSDEEIQYWRDRRAALLVKLRRSRDRFLAFIEHDSNARHDTETLRRSAIRSYWHNVKEATRIPIPRPDCEE